MAKITERQRTALNVIKDGGSIRYYCSPGADKGGFFFETKNCHNDLDGRTALGLEKSGLIEWNGDSYSISAAGKAALAQ